VQRVLREEPPKASAKKKNAAMAEPLGEEPDHLLTPTEPNQVWHMDFTCLRILWWQFTLAAVLDGFSRKLLCLRLYCRRPRSADVICLLRSLIGEYGKPRSLITDHGCQFRKRVAVHAIRAYDLRFCVKLVTT
jgi:transposase InsO family protein